MIQQIGTVLLAVTAACCASVECLNLARAEQSAGAAHLTCLQYRPLEEESYKKFRPPNPISAADGMGVGRRQTKIKTCNGLRTISEVDPPAAPASPKVAAKTQPPRNGEDLERQRARLHASALALYKATSTDAETFTAALLLPEIRRKVETALQQKLSDEQCRELARKARAEALYWYQYMQGLERDEAGDGKR
jgi:hypothetical protein